MKTLRVFLLAVVVFAFGGVLHFQRQKPSVEISVVPTTVTEQLAPTEPIASPSAPEPRLKDSAPSAAVAPTAKTKAAASSMPATPRSVVELRPATTTLRKEVAKDPHTTPQALTAFSIELGNRLDAVKTKNDANGFMDELQACLEQKDANGSLPAASVQTICLLDAKHLSEKFPALSSRLESLRAKADPRAQTAQKQIHD